MEIIKSSEEVSSNKINRGIFRAMLGNLCAVYFKSLSKFVLCVFAHKVLL